MLNRLGNKEASRLFKLAKKCIKAKSFRRLERTEDGAIIMCSLLIQDKLILVDYHVKKRLLVFSWVNINDETGRTHVYYVHNILSKWSMKRLLKKAVKNG